MYIKDSQLCRLIWRTHSHNVHLSMFMWFWHLALPVLVLSPCFSVLYCSMLKARDDSRILSGKSQMLEGMVASKSVSSSQSLNSTANRREKCLLGTQKHQGAVVQIAVTFIVLVVSQNKPLPCVEEQDCKFYTLCHGTHIKVVSLMLVRKVWPSLCRFLWNSQICVTVLWAVSCTEFHPTWTMNVESTDVSSFMLLSTMPLSLCTFLGISCGHLLNCCEFHLNCTKGCRV